MADSAATALVMAAEAAAAMAGTTVATVVRTRYRMLSIALIHTIDYGDYSGGGGRCKKAAVKVDGMYLTQHAKMCTLELPYVFSTARNAAGLCPR